MRSSTLIALVTVAAAAPAFAAPVHFARDTASSAQAPSGNESDAISLGTVSTIASVAAPVISGIIDHFKNNGNSQQRREAMEIETLLARSCGIACNPKYIFPVRDETDDSGAISFSTIKDVASIGGSVISAVHNLFGGSNQQTQRDVLELLVRDGGDQSDALSLGTIKDVASIGSSVISAVHNLFSGNNQQKQRELVEILARDDGDDSGALSFSTIKDVASIGGSVISAVHNLFGGNNQQKQRDVIELLARDDSGGSGALSLDVVKDVASIGSSVVSAVHNLFSGSNQQKQRELIEILARDNGDTSDALSLGVVKDVASIGSSVISAVHSLFGGNSQQQRRDVFDFEARTDDESDAISLKTIGTIASFAAPVVGGIIDHFTNNGQQQSREIFERELSELMARDDGDESDAISLKTIGTIASFAAPVVGGIIDHFTNNGQQQSRELFERELFDLIARDGSDESDAISLKTIGTIASFAAPVVGGIIDHFTNKGNGQQSREFLNDFAARSLNDLD